MRNRKHLSQDCKAIESLLSALADLRKLEKGIQFNLESMGIVATDGEEPETEKFVANTLVRLLAGGHLKMPKWLLVKEYDNYVIINPFAVVKVMGNSNYVSVYWLKNGVPHKSNTRVKFGDATLFFSLFGMKMTGRGLCVNPDYVEGFDGEAIVFTKGSLEIGNFAKQKVSHSVRKDCAKWFKYIHYL